MTTLYSPQNLILNEIIKEHGAADLPFSEVKEALNSIKDALESGESDFSLDFDGAEYRIIEDEVIFEIFTEELKQLVEDCYDLNLDNIPSFKSFTVDWEETAETVRDADGYGHHFSGYDGSELFVSFSDETKDCYIFRTN